MIDKKENLELRIAFEMKLAEKKPNIKLIGQYLDSKTKTEFECEYGHRWQAQPGSVLYQCGCPVCWNNKQRKTHEQFVQEMLEIQPTVKIIGQYVGSNTKVDVECLECGRQWSSVAYSLLLGNGCKPCNLRRGRQGVKDKAFAEIQADPHVQEHFEIISDYQGLRIPIRLRCRHDGYEFERQVASMKKCQVVCPICGSKGKRGTHGHTEKGINDLWTTHPHIAELLTNPEDGHKYSAQNCIQVNFTCPDCGNIAERWLSYVSKTMPYCQKCGDNMSYPERFFSAILRDLGIAFQKEVMFDWCKFEVNGQEKTGRYDFVFTINGQNYIVETDGEQHFREVRGFGDANVQEIDHIKQELAEKYGYSVIRIDCQESTPEYIRNSIEGSILADLFDLSRVDWIQCHRDTITSPQAEAVRLWNSGIKSTTEIMEIIGLKTRQPVRNYLKEAAEQGLCDYKPEEGKAEAIRNARKAVARPVILVNTGEIFESMNQAGKAYGTTSDKIKRVCEGERMYAGKSGGQPLVWRYNDEVRNIADELKKGLEAIEKSKENQSFNRQRGWDNKKIQEMV